MEEEVYNEKNEAAEVISAFEQILELAPDDMFALEALHDAYLSTGQTDKAFQNIEHLAKLTKNVSDHEMITRVADKLLFLETEFPEASELGKELEEKAKSTSVNISIEPTDGPKVNTIPIPERSIHQEIALAWKLYEKNQISKDDYTNISNDITETSSRDVSVPVSVMHALQDRAIGNLEKIIAFIASEGNAPLISLSNFDVQANAVKLLPLPFITSAGAMPIDFIAEDLMVAILNPFNKELKKSVEESSGRKCHFYLVTSPEYDRALEDIRKFQSEESVNKNIDS